jgi:predicted SAM-dependent methyltransferase
MSDKLHLGCGTDILTGYVNVDVAKLPGVDVVHDLTKRPWPFKDGQFSEVILTHVLEHLPETVEVMNELWRICAPGARVKLRVPYWNASDFITDPTHVKDFNEHTFDFFDPNHRRCQERPYYSKARFAIDKRAYHVKVFERYFRFEAGVVLRLLEGLAGKFCNVIQVMEFELVRK